MVVIPSKVLIFHRNNEVFLEIELCGNLKMDFALFNWCYLVIKQLVYKTQFYINHASDLNEF